ncbi:MAG: hypothetical protein FWJ66_11080 [Caldibacillus sp.]
MVCSRLRLFVIAGLIFSLLTGCAERNLQAAPVVPNDRMIAKVQAAVDAYYQDTGGLLPIKNSDADTDIYMKYKIDFNKLVPDYLMQTPPNAYEKGGIFQYVIINPETEPEVKVIDLRIAETIRTIHLRLRSVEYPPYKQQIGKNVFTLDYKKLGFPEDPVVISPFTGDNLPIVITGDGRLVVDYASDLYHRIQEHPDLPLEKGADIRWILVEDSAFVPAYSVPYTIDDHREPVFLYEP